MQIQHVHLVHLQIPQALFNRGHEIRLGEIVGPDLGGDAQICTGDATCLQRRPGIGLVAIPLCRVKGAVADLDRRMNGLGQDFALERERAKAALISLLKTDVHAPLRVVDGDQAA